jgi:phospholipid/cholesterol/gamma-HCH transport system substrate-binding protein
MVGKDQNLFGDTYLLKARFQNVQGLMAGNNVRFSGIKAGTVKKINILSDTVIEVTLVMEKKMINIIRKNAIASIGNEGLVGNKVVNIVPAFQPDALAVEGDILQSKKAIDTDEMLQTLYKTNNDLAVISNEIKTTIQQINSSNALWKLLNDDYIPTVIRASATNIRKASETAAIMANNLNDLVVEVKNGKGSIGELLTDTSFSRNLNEAILKIKAVGNVADSLVIQISEVVEGVRQDINNGKGAVNAVLKDSTLALKLNASLDNIQKGTEGFNQNMEALKHHPLFKGYYKKLEKQQKKEEKAKSAN